ncbi:unnamed protein product [Cunninghamella blakesleeana]
MVSSGLQDNSNDNWFYIRSIATGNVISCVSKVEPLLHSQVYVCPLKSSNKNDHDESLWKWENNLLKNKATSLVLDIRKGRIRMMEDTEICLCEQKSEEESHNQQWGLRECVDDLGRKQKGTFIYSIYNQEWVLDVGSIDNHLKGYHRLILFPSQTIDNDNQRWLIDYLNENPHQKDHLYSTNTTTNDHSHKHHPSSLKIDQLNINHQEDPATATTPSSIDAQSYHEFSTSSRSNSSADLSGLNFPYGLMPAKRGSQSSVHSLSHFKDSHQLVYVQQNQNLSEKSIALAAAYESWQLWKKEQDDPSIPLKEKHDKNRSTLQSMARNEATKLLNDTNASNNHQGVYNLVNRYIIQLYEQLPTTP